MTGAISEAIDTSAEIARYLTQVANGSGRVNLNPESIETDLARLVLGLMEFLRQLMELQAIQRMENGTLTADEEE